MMAAASSDGRSCVSLTISSAERPDEERGAGLGPQFAEPFHGQTGIALRQQGEGGLAVLIGKLRKELREVGRVLLLEQVHQVRRRAHALQALHGIEHDIELALRHRVSTEAEWELLNVARIQQLAAVFSPRNEPCTQKRPCDPGTLCPHPFDVPRRQLLGPSSYADRRPPAASPAPAHPRVAPPRRPCSGGQRPPFLRGGPGAAASAVPARMPHAATRSSRSSPEAASSKGTA